MRAIRLSSMRTTTYQSTRLSFLSCITERSGVWGKGGDMVAACMGNVKNSGGAAVSVAV